MAAWHYTILLLVNCNKRALDWGQLGCSIYNINNNTITVQCHIYPLASVILQLRNVSSLQSHLAQLLHRDHPVSITIKQFEGLFQAVDVLPGELPVRAESLCVPGHGWAGSVSITG